MAKGKSFDDGTKAILDEADKTYATLRNHGDDSAPTAVNQRLRI